MHFSERKTDSRKFPKDDKEKKPTTATHGSEKKNEKSREYKEKGQSEEKEKETAKVYSHGIVIDTISLIISMVLRIWSGGLFICSVAKIRYIIMTL